MELTFPLSRTPRSSGHRDIINFISLRQATPADDIAVAELLTHTFISTYREKLPAVLTSEERKRELRDVGSRRRQGHVCVAELGYRTIGSFSLIHPESEASEAWGPHGATLRCVAIDPEFHGLALSELLLNESDRIAKAWGARAIYLHVQKGASKVAILYQRHGYVRDAAGDKISFGAEIEGFRKDLPFEP